MIKQLKSVEDILLNKYNRVNRKCPIVLKDSFYIIKEQYESNKEIKGPDFKNFYESYFDTASMCGTRFFLRDERKTIHEFLENITKVVNYGEGERVIK